MRTTCRLWLAMAVVLTTSPVYAQTVNIPGSADAGRIDKRESDMLPPPDLKQASKPIQVLPTSAAPEQSKAIKFTLHSVVIEGMEAFKPHEMSDSYQDFLDKEITLDTAWLIAARITERYQNKGYFLSRAFVPEQKIDKDGTLYLRVVEGYIAEVKADDAVKDNSIINTWLTRLKSQKPVTVEFLESVLLQINDIPGVSVHATLEPVTPGAYVDGAVRMVLSSDETGSHGSLSFDNDGSKYLGPYELSADLATVLVPNQLTTLHYSTSIPADEMKYGTIRQRIPVFAGGFLELYGGLTKTRPGYTLRISEVESDSLSLGASLSYRLIRQRQENLTAKLAFETRDTNTDILTIPQTRDRIRVMRANGLYETIDKWQGYNQLSVTASQGLGIFDSSESGDAHLSRAEANPDFQKLEFTFSRSQAIGADLGLITSAAGQIASGPLFSSEEFGYGGAAFGRAFDSSELVGDHGFSAAVELRYLGFEPVLSTNATPYIFYDGGMVFNDDRTQEKAQTGMATGGGLRLITDFGASANFGVAFPLKHAVSTPIYAGRHDGYAPRYIAEISYGF